MDHHGGVPPRRVDYRENRLSRSIRPSSAVFPHYLSRSLHNVCTDSLGIPSWAAKPSLSQAHLPQLKEDEEKRLERVESRPVLRRRRFKHRKSINLEPDTSVILARGVVDSSSSDEEEQRPAHRRLSIEQTLGLARDQRSEEREEPKLRGPSARRFNRRNQQRAHLSMHCLPISEGASGPPSAFSAVVRSGKVGVGQGVRPATLNPVTTSYHMKAQSMADLHRGLDDEDALDFSSQASVSRWTSRMLAELESLPGSLMDINASSQSINRQPYSSDTVSMTSSNHSIDPPVHRNNLMTTSLIVDSDCSGRSRRSSTLTAPDTVSSRLAESINNLDQLLMESESIASGLDAIGRDTVSRKMDIAPPVPPHRSSVVMQNGGSLNSLLSASSELSRSRLSVISHNTEASGETLKLENEDGSSVRLSRTDLTLDLDCCGAEEHEPSPIGDLPLVLPSADSAPSDQPKQQKRRSVLEDDKYPLLQSIYRLSQSMYADSPTVDDSQTERMERWQRNKKSSCAERIGSSQPQLRAAKVASSVSIDTPPPTVDHVVQSLLRAAKKSERKDAVTQTSPALSRSSSFDWLESGSIEPSTPLSLRPGDASSGEDAADLEVQAVNSAASARKMRLDQTMDESLALLNMMAKDGVEQAATASPRNSRLSRVSRDSRSLRSSTLMQQQLQTTRPAQLPAPVTATRSTSSAMSESVYDNVHSERSRDEDDDDDDEILSVTSSEMQRPVLNPAKFNPLKGVKSVPSGFSSPRDSKFIDEKVALPSASNSTEPDDNPALKWSISRAEDKATEACRWLRSAGFPQYAHAYEEGSFPLQLDAVIADHAGILDTDSIHALSKRIATLNRCAIMRMDGVLLRDRSSTILADQHLHSMHSDEDGVALSGNWRYQRHSQTWSRMADVRNSRPPQQLQLQPVNRSLQPQRSVPAEQQQQMLQPPQQQRNSMLQRSHSERIKERAKQIIKKMDVRSNNKKKEHPPMVISDPVLLSYDSASPPSMRMMPAGLAPNSTSLPSQRLPAHGQRAHGFISPPPPSARSKSSHSRRQGIVFQSPISSPESSDDSTHLRLSRYGEGAPVRTLAPPAQVASRDRSVPTRFSRDYAVNRFSRADAERQRERLPTAAEYLYPANLANRNSCNPHRVSSGMPISSATRRGETTSSSMTASTTSSTASPFGTPQFARRQMASGTPRSAAALHAAMHGTSCDLDVRRLAPSSPRLLDARLAVETTARPVESDVDEDERRDSGAGSSLSRSPSSAPCTLRLRQSQMQSASAGVAAPTAVPLSCSFTSSTTASSCSSNGSCGRGQQKGENIHTVIPATSLDSFFTDAQLLIVVDSLSAMDMAFYRKISHLRLTSILEKHMFGGRGGMINIEEESAGGSHGRFHKLMKRFKAGDSKTKEERSAVFGASLADIRRRSGACLPHAVFEILRFLRVHAPDAVGIFRKNGVKSRITELKELANTEHEGDVFVDQHLLNSSQVHDVADLLKQYLRELPEPLMTSRLSKTFATIFEHVPEDERLAALRYAIVLLPEENREALQTLLLFFNEVAGHATTNSMSADNISVCLTPSLFALSASRLNSVTPSRRHKTIGGTGMPTEAEMAETRAAQKCLSTMITNVTDLFVVRDQISGEKHSEYEEDFPILKSLNNGDTRSYLQHHVQDITADRNGRWPNWIVEGSHDGVEMSSKKIVDGHQLKHFRVWTDISAPPRELLYAIKNKRILWDPTYLNQRLMENMGKELELFQYVWNDSPGHPTRDVCVVRLSVSDLLLDTRTSACCVLVERSVFCSETQMMGGVPAAVLEMKWLIEPHGQGRSRVTLVSRVDLRGRHADWYCAQYGHMMARSLGRLRDFHKPQCQDDGPETKI